jgi:formate dehydrogenase subunit gamma
MKDFKFVMFFLLSILLFNFASTALAFTNEECLACHNSVEPKVDINVLNKSVHNRLPCSSCHSDIQTLPHKKSLTAVNCANCHSNIAKEMVESIHYKSNKENKPNCVACHGSHDILPASNEQSKTNFFNIPSLCITCHNDTQIYENSIHSQALQEKGLTGTPVCTTCHGAHLVLPSSDNRSKTYFFNIHESCGDCHKKILSDFEKSIHGKNILAGNKSAPTCTTCHSEHKIAGITRVTLYGLETEECGKCHLEQSNIYQDSFHGRATFSGFERSATCTDCHNTHLILPQNDPASTINKLNIDNTCGKCHSLNNIGSQANTTQKLNIRDFSKYKIHTSISTVLLFKAGYMAIIAFLIVAFIIHYLLIGPKEFNEEDKIYWFTLSQRVVHWGAAVTFVVLIITGLIMIFADTFGGGLFVLISRYVHRIFAFLFIIFDIVIIKMWWKYYFTKIYDIKWLVLIGGYLHRKKIHVPAGKFNFGQKMWLIFSSLGGLIMFITGLVIILLAPDIKLLRLSIYIHNIFGMILVGFFMIHLYMSIFVIKGSVKNMIDGYKSKEEAEYMHGFELKKDDNNT